MNNHHTAEHLFHGAFAEEYHFLMQISPQAAEMSRRVGAYVADWVSPHPCNRLEVLEIGCGTGITTKCLEAGRNDIRIVSMDNAPAMLKQARCHLAREIAEGRVELIETDALSHLQAMPDNTLDVVASAYVFHNFLSGYRRHVLAEVLRVLKPGGVFVNGDRYAFDDPAEHLRSTQNEVKGWFRQFRAMNRLDLLEQWVVHLFSDESPEHIMPLATSRNEMLGLGFDDVRIHHREGVNTLLTGMKPWQG